MTRGEQTPMTKALPSTRGSGESPDSSFPPGWGPSARPSRWRRPQSRNGTPVYSPDSAFSASAIVIIKVSGSTGDTPNPCR